MLKKIFRPKGWLIGTGVIHFIMGVIVQMAMSADVATMGWGEGNVGPHDLFYEAVMGFLIIPHVVALLAAAFLFEGVVQARLAVILGGSMMLSFVGMAFHTTGTTYMAEAGAVAAFAPPIILFGGLTLAGALGWNAEPASS